MPGGESERVPSNARVFLALLVVLLLVLVVWKVIDYRGQPPPPPARSAPATAPR